MRRLTVLLISALAVLTVAQKPDEFPDIADIMANGYEAEVEVTISDGQGNSYSQFAEEYHDLKLQRGRVDMIHKAMSLYYSSSTNQVVQLQGQKCDVFEMEKVPMLELSDNWGWLDSEKKIIGPSAVLHRKTNSPHFVEQKTIRGILCNKFTANDFLDDQVTVEYYFSASNWLNPITNITNTPIPVRVVCRNTPAKRNSQVNVGEKNRLDILFDFTMFKSNAIPALRYQIPHGIGCPGIKSPEGVKMPLIMDQYSMIGELYNIQIAKEHEDSIVYLIKTWFDASHHLVKLIVNQGSSQMTQILDFNTGVSYEISEEETKCNIGPIPKQNFAEKHTTGESIGNMKTATDFLGLSGNYYYLGKEFHRGIYCDVWETVKTNITYITNFMEKAVFTYYFMTPNFEAVSSGDITKQIPVGFLITGFKNLTTAMPEPDVRVVYNMFKFDQDALVDNHFDMNIEPCFEEQSQRQLIMIHYDSDETKTNFARNNSDTITMELILKITEAAVISPLRLPSIKIYYEPIAIKVLILMLNRPPVISGFINRAEYNVVPTNKMSANKNIESADMCAELCLQSAVKCKLIVFCENECFLGSMDTNDDFGVTLDGKYNCSLYERSVTDSTYTEASLEDSLKTFDLAFKSKKLNLQLTNDKNEIVDFIATKIDYDIKPNNWHERDNLYEAVDTDFQLLLPEDSWTTIQAPGDVNTMEGCYQKCVNEKRIFCASFSFCPTQNECRLTTLYLDISNADSVKEMVPATGCTVYRKTAFQFFEETPGKIPEPRGFLTYSNVRSQEQCAVWCKDENSLECRGFEYCESSRSCILHESHVLDNRQLIDSKNSKTCTHFMRKYSAEFTILEGFILIPPKGFESAFWAGASFEACAKMCFEMRGEELSCRSINYCPENEMCGMNSLSIYDIKNGTFEESNECQHYFLKEGYISEWDVVYPEAKDYLSKGYSVHVDVTKTDQQRNIISRTFYDEFHDVNQQRGRLELFDNGQKTSFYYFNDIGQKLVIKGKDMLTCKVIQFGETPDFLKPWGMTHQDVIGPSSVLWRRTKKTPESNSKDTIRGILVSGWTADDHEDNVTLQYYVSAPSWIPVNPMQIDLPVAVIATGNFGVNENENTTDIRLDFTNFQPSIPQISRFMVPKGIGCKDFKPNNGKKMPTIGNKLTLISEQYNKSYGEEHPESIISIFKIDWDGSTKLVRFEGDDEHQKRYISVADFNTGVEYRTDEFERCTIWKIPKSEDVTSGNKLLGLDGNFYYLGRELCRGINCDVWESVKENIEFFGLKIARMVLTVHFMAPNFRSDSPTVDQTTNRIISLTYYIQQNIQDKPVPLMFNVFAFDDSDKMFFYDKINIDNCFENEQKDNFVIHFKSTPDEIKIVQKNNQEFQLATLLDISRITEVPFLRLPKLRLHYGPSEVIVLGMIIDKPNTKGVQSDEPSLKEALSNLKQSVDKRELNIILSYGVLDSITLSAVKFDDQITARKWKDTDLYETVVTNRVIDTPSETIKEIQAPNADECYQLCIKETRISCSSFSFCKVNGKCILSSVYIDPDNKVSMKELNPVESSSCNVYRESSLRYYESYPGLTSERKSDKEVQKVKTAAECAQICRKDKDIKCKGFEFCNQTQSCDLHKSHFLDSPSKTGGSTSCTHYSMRHSLEFANMGRFVLMTKNTKPVNVLSFEECTKTCYEKTDFDCRSINFCKFPDQDSYSCDLMDKTSSEVGTSLESSLSCQHYFRNDLMTPRRLDMGEEGDKRSTSGHFAGTAIGVMIFGIFLGIIGFLGYSYFRSRSGQQTGDGLSVRFVKSNSA